MTDAELLVDHDRRITRLETVLTTFIDETRQQRAEIVPALKALLEAQSGERADFSRLRSDVERSWEKHRAHDQALVEIDKRLDRIEARFGRLFWMFSGAQATLLVLVWFIEHFNVLAGIVR